LFYDSLHPSSTVHRFVADAAAAAIADSQPQPVPESVSVMALVLIGGALCLRRRSASV
jgi:phospholipase/lecithinase/hemolysin